MLVKIIRQCPVVAMESEQGKGLKAQYLCLDWLLENVGSQFLVQDTTAYRTYVRLRRTSIAGPISKSARGCSEQVWNNIRPYDRPWEGKRKGRLGVELPSNVKYFAPDPDLMRACRALDACRTAGYLFADDVWLALMVLPSSFLNRILEPRGRQSDLAWRLALDLEEPTTEQIAILERG